MFKIDTNHNNELEHFKRSLVNLNLSQIYDIEKQIIKDKDLIKLEILRVYVYNNFDKTHHC
jgi:hypothetical protein